MDESTSEIRRGDGHGYIDQVGNTDPALEDQLSFEPGSESGSSVEEDEQHVNNELQGHTRSEEGFEPVSSFSHDDADGRR